jgi:hypothetical protein
VQRKKKYPIKVEKNGVTVPIYRVHSGTGYTSFVISYQENGSRKRQGFGVTTFSSPFPP